MEIDDEIHGKVALSPVCAAFYRHPHFERLRRVRQMGSGWLVFPNATHTRHEHSVGVCHLAGRMLDALGVRDPALREPVLVAALYHDTGHAPFSHTFDRFGEVRFEHEARSQHLLLAAFEDLRREGHPALREAGFGEASARRAARLIDPPPGPDGSSEAHLEQIVSNRDVIDVDKLDYLMRDCSRLTGQPLDIDVYGLIDRCAVCGGRLTFDLADREAVRRLLDRRTRFHRLYYCHTAVEASGWMLAQLTHAYLHHHCVLYDDLDSFCCAVSEIDDTIYERLLARPRHPLHGMAKRIQKKRWIRHVRDSYHRPAARESRNLVVIEWDVEVSRHTSHNALHLIPFHDRGQPVPPPPAPDPRGALVYRVFRHP